eukprot:1073153-Karenia_brevis.AAC.1
MSEHCSGKYIYAIDRNCCWETTCSARRSVERRCGEAIDRAYTEHRRERVQCSRYQVWKLRRF